MYLKDKAQHSEKSTKLTNAKTRGDETSNLEKLVGLVPSSVIGCDAHV